jgi:DNA-binding transcriptional LysR family regulator
MNVNFEYYKIFYFVAKYKNLTKAAKMLGSSQPNVTRAMNLLEEQVHASLLVRNNRGVQLTPEGEKLYIRVNAAMAQLMAAEEELEDITSLSHGSVYIGASEMALNIYLLEQLKEFHMVNQGIRLKIYNYSTPEAVDAVKNGLIDFAVVSSPVYTDASIKTISLYSFQEILVGGTTFTALGSQELSINELQDYPLICLGRETMTYRFYKDLFSSHGVELEPDTEVATADQILPLVKCELGLSFLPKSMTREALEKKEIVRISLKDQIPQRHICLVYDNKHPISLAARQLRKRIAGI